MSALWASQHRWAIRPWLDEPRQSLCRPSGPEQPSLQAQRVDSMAAGATQSPGHGARSMSLLGNPELDAQEDFLALQASQNQPSDVFWPSVSCGLCVGV